MRKRKHIPLIMLGAAFCVAGATYALARPGPTNAPTASKSAPALSASASPFTRSVARGEIAHYTVRIRRRAPVLAKLGMSKKKRLSLRTVRLRVLDGVPPGATAVVRPSSTLKPVATLIVRTLRAPSGKYRIRLRARSRKGRATTAVNLVIRSSEQPTNFTISGDLPSPLKPGLALPVDLALRNPGGTEIGISSLVVSVESVTAPLASADYPCTLDDFEVTQFSGAYGFTLGSSSTSTLSELGVPADQWPQVGMLNRPVNQNGCKGASLELAFSGASTGGTP